MFPLKPTFSVIRNYRRSFAVLLSAFSLLIGLLCTCGPLHAQPTTWWKGNLHTHTLWSDGDDYPEMVVEWYKTNGYHFLVLSDHNITQEGEKWTPITTNPATVAALDKYLERFGPNWVEQQTMEGTQMVRLKALREFRRKFEVPEKYLLMMGEEISATAGKIPVHIGAVNIRKELEPIKGTNVLEVMQQNIDAVLQQRKATGRRMFPHVNHPNFNWAITAEDLMQVRGDRFFEVYNGHPAVRNDGDSVHPSTERMWDITLAFRLERLHLPLLYGLAVDDSHNYQGTNLTLSNPGRGWVMVRSLRLLPEAIAAALEAGDFYATTGVRLTELTSGTNKLSLQIDAQSGVSYVTQFIGTRIDFDDSSEPVQSTNSLPVTRSYSSTIGEVFAQVEGITPSYTFRGDEIYVRAKVISSKPKVNGFSNNEVEVAWTQPVLVANRQIHQHFSGSRVRSSRTSGSRK